MEYTILDIEKIQIGDSLVLDIDVTTQTFPEEYAEAIKYRIEYLKAETKAYIYSKELKIRILFSDKNFKKIGIVVDNYKLEKMKNELFKKGYKLQEIAPLSHSTTAIKFDVPADKFEIEKAKIFAITSSVEAHFKRRN